MTTYFFFLKGHSQTKRRFSEDADDDVHRKRSRTEDQSTDEASENPITGRVNFHCFLKITM